MSSMKLGGHAVATTSSVVHVCVWLSSKTMSRIPSSTSSQSNPSAPVGVVVQVGSGACDDVVVVKSELDGEGEGESTRWRCAAGEPSATSQSSS